MVLDNVLYQSLTCHNHADLPQTMIQLILDEHHNQFPPSVEALETSVTFRCNRLRFASLNLYLRDDFGLLNTLVTVISRCSSLGFDDYPHEHGRYSRRRFSSIRDSPPLFETLVNESNLSLLSSLLSRLEITKTFDNNSPRNYLPFFSGTLAEDCLFLRRLAFHELGRLNDFTSSRTYLGFITYLRSRSVLTRNLKSKIKSEFASFLNAWFLPLRLLSPQYINLDRIPLLGVSFDKFNGIFGNQFWYPEVYCGYHHRSLSTLRSDTTDHFVHWIYAYSQL